MESPCFPVIDAVRTGQNITRLRVQRGLSVRDLQAWFDFEEPQAVYKWQRGQSLPSVDNLYALSALFGVTMNDILVSMDSKPSENERQTAVCCSDFFRKDFSLVYMSSLAGKLANVIELIV